LKKVEEVTDGLNNMCTVVGDIMFFVARVAGYGGARCCGEKSRDDVRLGSTWSGRFLVRDRKIFMDSNIRATFVGASVATQLLMDKVMDLKVHFQNL
jgi:hypothetical protein